IPFALLVERDAAFSADGLAWGAFLLDNLLPVTIGNVFGGAVMVGAVYWFVYLRPARGAGG
ncbi:MAG TPA: formate/nitrite transporter family protein, partial [Gaiellaceae bacterium]|nr:formate/nitrite transporter family protein [Gaiellaceae bacterium]